MGAGEVVGSPIGVGDGVGEAIVLGAAVGNGGNGEFGDVPGADDGVGANAPPSAFELHATSAALTPHNPTRRSL